jgi:hypothetical protein
MGEKGWSELRRLGKALSQMDDGERMLLLGMAQRLAQRYRAE